MIGACVRASVRHTDASINGFSTFAEGTAGALMTTTVFIVLARPEGAPPGGRGLATFIVPRQLPDGSTNGFHMRRCRAL